MGHRTVATLANNSYFNCGNFGHDRASNYSHITFFKVGYIMIPVYFINPMKTAFFDHGKGSTGTFLCWLEKETDFSVLGYLVSVLY
jgi:hypothetical protein